MKKFLLLFPLLFAAQMLVAQVTLSCTGTKEWRETFGSTNGNLGTNTTSTADAPWNNTGCYNGFIRSTTVGEPFSSNGISADVGIDGDVGSHFLFHLSGTGAGCTYAAGQAVWKSVPVINILAGQQYEFSYYIALDNATGPPNLLQVITPATGTITIVSTTTPASSLGTWVKRTVIFTASANTSVVLRINNTTSTVAGNDFGLDNITLKLVSPATPIISSASNACPSSNTYNLNAVATTGCSSPNTIEWYSVATNPTISNLVATPNAVSTGSYYAFCKNVSGCLSDMGAGPVSLITVSCVDTDGDGIYDKDDADDDNDGITDFMESPSCYYTFAEASVISKITSSLTSPDDNQADGDIQILHDGNAAFTFNYNGFQNLGGASLATIIYPTSVTLTSVTMTLGASLGNFSTAKLQGSSDSSSWLDLSSAIALTSAGAKLFTVTSNAGEYKYYRILGVAAVAVLTTGTISEITSIADAATYNQIAHPKPTCNEDKDGDGILNQFDLDSDNDGCSDAVEAGNVAKAPPSAWTSTTVYPVANPTTTSSSTYTAYALDSTINFCTLPDCDGDGVPNLTDLDDDNDGVSDALETPCSTGLLVDYSSRPDNVPLGGQTVPSAIPGLSVVHSIGGQYNIWEGPESAGQPYSIFKGANTTAAGVMSYDFSVPVKNLSYSIRDLDWNTTTLGGEVGKVLAYYQGQLVNPSSVVLGANIVPSTYGAGYYRGTNDNSTVTSYANGLIYNFANLLVDSLVAYCANTQTGSSSQGNLHTIEGGCALIDTDKDGTPDVCDLDSDGDGCADAVEAGNVSKNLPSAWKSTTIYPATVPAVITSSNYTIFALDSTINFCNLIDTDNDGILDQDDLDDDNDGVLDITENCIGYRAQNTNGTWLGNTTSSLTVAAPLMAPQTNIQALIDGQNNYYVNQNGAQQRLSRYNESSNNLTYTFSPPVPISEIAFYIEDVDPVISNSSGSLTLEYTILVNGVPSSNLKTTPYGKPVSQTLIYNGGTGKINLNGNVNNDQGILLKGQGSTLVSTITLSSTGLGLGDLIAYSLFAYKDCDTDGDGIPNRLDPDADGDGCSDAYESGATTTKTLSTIAGPYGSNGLANSLENNDGQTATTNYTNTYASNALDSTINICKINQACATAASNIITNGGFQTGAIASTTGWSLSGTTGWIPTTTNGLGNVSETTVADSVAQTINICQMTANDLIVDFDLKIKNGATNGLSSQFDVYFNNTLYMRIATSNALNTIDTFTYFNGASSNIAAGFYNSATTPIPISITNTPPTTYGHVTLKIPVPQNLGQGLIGRLAFAMKIGAGAGQHDDYYLDNVAVSAANCLSAGPDTVAKTNTGNCLDTTANLNGTSYYTGSTTWTALATNPGTSVIANPTNEKTSVKSFSASGIYKYVISSGTCTDTMQVNVTLCPATIVKKDTVTKTPACPTCPITACPTADDLPIAAGITTFNTCGVSPITFGSQTQDPATGCITFTPNGTQGSTDTVVTCAVACKNGICDTTVIKIAPPIKPDTIKVTPACPTCPVTVCATGNDLGAGPFTYATCGIPAEYDSVTSNGCITLTPKAPLNNTTDNTCIVKCDAAGKCDTTYIIINPPITPDTITVTPACATCPVSICPTGNDLGAGPFTYKTCGIPAEYDSAIVSGCLTLTPKSTLNNAPDNTCIVKCDANNLCDTTYIIINPPITPDTITVTPACATCPVTICPTGNDLGAGPFTYKTCGIPSEYDSTIVGGCLTLTPNTQLNNTIDNTCIVKCDASGKCDTTYVIINPPITPDTITVTPACPTCPVSICPTGNDLGAGPFTYTTCGAPAEYSANVNTTTGCVTLTPNAPLNNIVDNTCIVKCDASGKCDTTYIVINPPIKPDTVKVTPACPTCPVTACATGDDLGVGPFTYTTCGALPEFGSNVNTTTGCVTLTPNAPLNNTADNTCIVKCDASNKCDTTYIIINPPIKPDTVKVTPACPTCPVTVCATGDDLGAGPFTYTTCGVPTEYNSNVNTTTGCVTLTPNAPLNNIADNTCIVKCDASGKCDTTYIIINPPIRPDTIILKPTCPTCPVQACPTANDIIVNASTTYTTCGVSPADATQGTYVTTPNGCLIWQGNAGFTKDTIETCVVACNNTVCDTTRIIILPPTPPYGPDTIYKTPACIGCATTPTCPTADDVPVGYTNIVITNCGLNIAESTQGTLTTDANNCIIFTPNATQTDTVSTCVIKCADTSILGNTFTVCDTTIVFFAPPPVKDTIYKTPACPTCTIVACPTADDVIINSSSAITICGLPNSMDTTGTNASGCFTFTPTSALDNVPDTTCISVCTNGVCDTTYLIILPPITPDTKTVTPACPTCIVTVCPTGDDLGAGPFTYKTCGAPAEYTIDSTGGCLTLTPKAPLNNVADNTCIVKCDASGKCDTTYIIINPPIKPDTITVIPACLTCTVTACATGDDLGAGPFTYKSCGIPTEFDSTIVNGCITLTPKTSLDNATDNTCIVKCDANNLCDTTYIIINPPITPDTKTVTPACPTCPVIVCPTGDNLGAGPFTYKSCSIPIEFDSTIVNGCLVLTPNTPLDNVTDNTCIVKCDANNNCDTTYIIINPPIKPDTITLTPACPTCTVTVCATGDDLGAGPFTYKTCGIPAEYDSTIVSGCITLTPNIVLDNSTDNTCIVKCDASGKCDTTYIIINPPIKPDTQTVTPACPTCPVTVCATGDDLGAGPFTYKTCGIPTEYDSTVVNGCLVLTPNTPLDKVADNTCIVKCDANNLCDTTYFIINPPITPDTITVTPACPTCPVTVCPTGDDLGAGPFTYKTCGIPTEYDSTIVNGCLVLTPNTPLNTIADNTCIVKCDANNLCDTTYIIINPPLIPKADPDVNVTYVNVPVTGNVSTNDDKIPPGSTYYNPLPNPANPDASLPVINTDGTYTFTSPVPGVFTFNVPLVQPNGDTIFTTLTITVTEPYVNNPPVAITDQATTNPGVAVIIPTLANDQPGNNDSPLVPGTVTIKTAPKNGTASVDLVTGDITYQPNAGFSGKDTLFYYVKDADGDSAIAMQIITVLPPNDPNTTDATDDYATTKPSTPATGTALSNDFDNEGDLQQVIPQNITVPEGTFVIDVNGNYTFTPVPGFSGPVNFPYTVYDNNAKPDTTMATIYILVEPVAPAPNPDVNVTWVNVPVNGNVSTNDNVIPSGSTYGAPIADVANINIVLPTLAPDGSYSFTNTVPGIYHFKVPLITPTNDTILVDLQITVLDSALNNNPPAANTDIASTAKDVPVTLKTLSNDVTSNTGTGVGLNPSTVAIITAPKNGTTSIDPLTGDILYTPDLGFVGIDTIKYEVKDSLGNTVTAFQIITIVDTIKSLNATSASDDYNAVKSSGPVSGNALSNDTDAEGDVLSITPQMVTKPGVGTLVLNADGTYTFTPEPGYIGAVDFPYEVLDARGAKANATIYFLINATTSPLNIGIVLFGNAQKMANQLQWSAVDNKNIKDFELQRLQNNNFISIDKQHVNATQMQYNFIDKNLSAINYYRLKINPIQGLPYYSNVLTIKRKELQDVLIYPNPIVNIVNIDFNISEEKDILVNIYDASGKVVRKVYSKSIVGANTITVDASILANGIYTIELISGNSILKSISIRKD